MTTETYFGSMMETVHEDPRPGAWRVLADYLEDDGDSKRAELAAITAEMLEGNPARQARAQELIKDGVKPVAVKETLEANGVEFTFSLVPAVYHYYVGTTPVTQAQWRAVMGTDPSDFKGDDRPVEKVSWHEAQEFCKKARTLIGKPVSLLTEAEWEYACRAGTTTEYYSGDTEEDPKRAGWFYGNSGNQTQPVGKLEPNVLGLHDMHGNVWEWCQDVYTETPPDVQALTPRPVEGENSLDPTQRGLSGAGAGSTVAGSVGPRSVTGSLLRSVTSTWVSESATKEGEDSLDPTGRSGAGVGTNPAVTAGPRSATGTILATGSTSLDSESATKEGEDSPDPQQVGRSGAVAGSTVVLADPEAETGTILGTEITTSDSESATKEGEDSLDPTLPGCYAEAVGSTLVRFVGQPAVAKTSQTTRIGTSASESATQEGENSSDPTQIGGPFAVDLGTAMIGTAGPHTAAEAILRAGNSASDSESASTPSSRFIRRVIRGASWNFFSSSCPSANRYWYVSIVRAGFIGFRICFCQEQTKK